MRKIDRGYTDIVSDLTALKNGNHIHDTMIEALVYGYTSARTNQAVEAHLYRDDDLAPFVADCVICWNGQDYLSGALYAAQTLRPQIVGTMMH
jgi:hypothetical protein